MDSTKKITMELVRAIEEVLEKLSLEEKKEFVVGLDTNGWKIIIDGTGQDEYKNINI